MSDKKYICVVDSSFIRDAQVLIKKSRKEENEKWADISGDIFIGVFDAESEASARKAASDKTSYPVSVIRALKLSGQHHKQDEKNARKIYRIYLSSAAGLDFTGIKCNSEDEAKELCEKYNKGDNNPYCKHVYR